MFHGKRRVSDALVPELKAQEAEKEMPEPLLLAAFLIVRKWPTQTP